MTGSAILCCAINKHAPLRRLTALGMAGLCLTATPLLAQSEPDTVVVKGQDSATGTIRVTDQPAQPVDNNTDETVSAQTDAPAETQPERVTTRLVWSQFADVPVSGSAQSTLRYGGKVDAYVDVKGSTIGLDDSISLHFHPEFKYGASSNGEIGLIPENTQLFYPGEGDVFDLSVNVTKRWKSGTTLTVGKVNILDLAARIPIQGGGGHEGFQNLATALPPSAIVPGSITGAVLNIPTEKVLYRLLVFDPELQSRRSGLEDPFSKGIGMLASVTFPVKIGGKRGYYALKLAASSRSELATEALPAALVPAPGSNFGNRKGEVAGVFAFQQFLSEDAANPGGGIGIFGQVYVSNGNPTFLDASGFIGISGNPKSRPQDRFGLTYFRYSLANGLVDALNNRLALQDEEGIEAFYTFGLSKNLRVTANVQAVDSAVTARDFGVTAGMRVTALF